MTRAFGGPNVYCGRLPVAAHEHIHITGEVFETRNVLLRESLDEAGVGPEVADAWMKLDNAFRSSIVKTGTDQCRKRFIIDEILDFRDPLKVAS